MATLLRKPGKSPRHEIQFFDQNGKRASIYLGRRYDEKTAHETKDVVEALVYAKDNPQTMPSRRTTAWIESAPSQILEKLVKVGLLNIQPTYTTEELFVDKKNDCFVSMDDYRQLLTACPCQDWRTILALTRIGGLRCPNEVLRLRWVDVDWEQCRFFVRYERQKEGRWVPLFPELREELEALFKLESSVGKDFVISRYRDASQNLRLAFDKIVERAGLERFHHPFSNMRMARSNEVCCKWGPILEKQWIGLCDSICEDHCSDTDFQQAAEWAAPTDMAAQPEKQSKCRDDSAASQSSALSSAVNDEIDLQSIKSVQEGEHVVNTVIQRVQKAMQTLQSG